MDASRPFDGQGFGDELADVVAGNSFDPERLP